MLRRAARPGTYGPGGPNGRVLGRSTVGAPTPEGRMRNRWCRRAAAGILLALLVPAAGAADEPPRSFTLTAGGDILIHRTLAQIADANAPGAGVYDFAPMLDPIEPWVGGADLAICHLEGALDPKHRPLVLPAVQRPPRGGRRPRRRRLRRLFHRRQPHPGPAASPGRATRWRSSTPPASRHAGSARSAESASPASTRSNGVTVGHISYTYGTNGIPAPPTSPGR